VAQINLITFPWLVRSVNVQPGGVLLVSVPTDTPAREIERVAQLLKETLNGILPEDAHIQIILAYEGITVEGLDEKMMAQCGWQRIPNPPS
jgi:hypothetical protein